MVIEFGESAQSVRGLRQEEDFSFSLVYAPTLTGTVTNLYGTVVGDLSYNGETALTTKGKYDISLELAPDVVRPVLSSLHPSILTIDQDGVTTMVASSGTATVLMESPTGSRKTRIQITTSGGYNKYTEVVALQTGSLRKYLYDQQIAALAGVVAGASAQRAGVYGNGIAAGLNTAVAMSGSYGGANTANFIRAQAKAGFAGFPLDLLDQVLDSGHSGNGAGWRAWISPHHFLTWRGHGASDGSTWRAINGEIIVEYSATPWSGTLAKILPSTFRNYMPICLATAQGTFIPVWARLYNTYDNKSDATAERRWVMPANFTNLPFGSGDTRYTYQKQASGLVKMANGGDSGSPVFCGINGNLVMLSHTAYQGSVGTLEYGAYLTQINAAMAALNGSGTYTVGTADLSGFTSYA